MKWLLIFIFLLAIPQVSATEIIEYIESFDVDYGKEENHNNIWGGSDYRYFQNILGNDFDNFVESLACGDINHCPTGYSFLPSLVSLNEDCSSGNYWVDITYEDQLNFNTLYGSTINLSYYGGTDNQGSYKMGICETGLGCTETSWFSLGGIFTDYNRIINIPESFGDMIGDIPTMSELDQIYLKASTYKGGCSGDKSTIMFFWNITIKFDSHIPSKVRVWDGTNSQWLEGVNVTLIGETYKSDLTDSNGIVHDNDWLENGSYSYSMTKEGYYSLYGSWDLQPCEVTIAEVDTYTEYASNCGAEDRPMYEIPVNTINYNIEVVDINNIPVNNSFITMKQSQFPYSFISDYTDENGLVSFALGTLSTYDYTIGKTNFSTLSGSFSTNTSNVTVKFVLLELGCLVPTYTRIAGDISPFFDVYITNFSVSHTQNFKFELPGTEYLQSFTWKLDRKLFAYNYPDIDITFEETGDRLVEVRAIQSDCILGWAWNVHISDIKVPVELQNYTTTTHYTKQEFLNLLKYFVPVLFPVVLIFTLYKLLKRIGRKSKVV